MRGSILFVCSANVCRSPLMQYTLLDAAADEPGLTVASAGVSARAGAPICGLSLSAVRSPTARPLAEAHRSAPVDDAALQSDLVIVASRAERAVLAQRDPDSRSRLFTLSEAVLLGRCAAVRRGAGRTETMGDYARLLDAQRGMLVIPRPGGRRRFMARDSAHPLDIPDGHHLRRHAHAGVLKRVRAEAEELSEQLASFSAG